MTANDSNPYQAPEVVQSPKASQDIAFAPCPNCGNSTAQKVGWTFWGGALGPSMLTHVRCESCGAAFNGKTGKSNTIGIVVYMIVTFGLGAALVFYMRSL